MMRTRNGFTLIELLIALSILALVATLGYRALAALTDSEARLAAEGVRWRNLDALFARIEADARAAQPRDVRTGTGTEPAWSGSVGVAGDAELSVLPRRPRIRTRSRERRPAHRLPLARRRASKCSTGRISTSRRRRSRRPTRWRATSRGFA